MGEADPHGVSFTDEEFSKVAVYPRPDAWQIGRRNPGRAIFEAVERLLRSWNCGHDGTVDTYALKELRMSSECLVSLTNGLRNLPRVHEIARITVIKYWYDPSWPEPHTVDLALAEFSLDIPFRSNGPLAKRLWASTSCPCSFVRRSQSKSHETISAIHPHVTQNGATDPAGTKF